MIGRSVRRLVGTASAAVLAVPAMAQGEPPPLSAYGALPAVEDVAISPGGRLAMLATSGGKRILALLDTELKPAKMVEVGELKVRDIDWAGDEAVMVLSSQTIDLDERFLARNAEISQAMIVPANGDGPVHTIFADDRSMVHAVFGKHGFRQIDGQWTGLFAGRAMTRQPEGTYYYEGGASALYGVNLATNRGRRLTSAPVNDQYADWLVDAQGEVAATLTFTMTNGNWRIVNARSREIAQGQIPKGGVKVLGFGAESDRVVYSVSPERGPPRFFEVALDGSSEPQELWAGKEIDAVFLDPGSERLIGYQPDTLDDDVEPVFFDPAIQAKVTKVTSAFRPLGGVLHDWTPDFSRILVNTAGSSDSGTWFLVDTVAGRSTVVGKSRPQIAPHQVGPVSTIHYEAQDGLEIEAILTLPPGREAKGLPLVMLPHGGPRAHDDETFDWWAQAFASRGYAVLQPNFRGSTEHGEEFLHAGDGEWGKKMQTDLSDGLAYLAEQGTVDPARACIVGASYGGYAALAGVTLQQDLYRCAVSVAGVSDLELFLDREYRESGESKNLRDEWLEMMGPRSSLSEVSPRRLASKADAPVLLIHGRDDTIVPYEQSTRMADALKDAGKPYRLVELRGEDHWLSRSETRNQMLEAAVAFVQEHNPSS